MWRNICYLVTLARGILVELLALVIKDVHEAVNYNQTDNTKRASRQQAVDPQLHSHKD